MIRPLSTRLLVLSLCAALVVPAPVLAIAAEPSAAAEPVVLARAGTAPPAGEAAAPPVALAESKAPQRTAEPTGVVRGFRIEGEKRVDEGAIRIHITHPTGVPVDRSATDLDVKSIYKMGFFDNVWVTTEPAPGGVTLVYHVEERPYVARLEFEGNENVEKADLEAVVGIRPRTVFDPQRAWEGLREAKKVYAGEGYPDAEIRYELVKDVDGNVTVRYVIDEKNKVLVDKINFQGVHAFSHFKLRRIMSTRKKWIGGWFTGAGILKDEELQTDVERLTAFYYDNGYIQVRVDDIEVTREDDNFILTVRIEEGDQYRIGNIRFEGEVLEDQDKLALSSGLKSGEIFKPSRLRESIFSVTEEYGNLGRAFAEAVPNTDVHPDLKTVDVTFKMTAGPVVKVDRIEVRGNTKTRDEVVRRELRQQEGEQFSGRGLRQGTARVKRLGIFDEVKVESTKTAEADQVNLVVNVKEGRTGTFSAGAGFSSEDSLLANARITERNLFGRAQTATMNVDFGSRRQNYRLGFVEPWAFDIPLSLGIDAFSWSYEFSDFRRGGTGMSLRASYPLWELGLKDLFGASLDDIRVGLEYRLENTVIKGVSRSAPASIENEQGTRLTSSLRPSIVRNTIDQPFDPTEGSINTVSAEFAGLGGENEFTKFDVSSRWYFPFYKAESGWRLVYAIAGTFGYGVGNGGLKGEDLPLSERYFPGGINTVRGFQSRTLGPREDFCDHPNGVECRSSEIGGSSQLIVNNEIIFPIIPDAGVKGVVFFDAGNAWKHDEGIDLGDLRLATGVGLRWLSPFGPLRIEIGFPLNEKHDDETSLVLFSFGTPY
ncbi:MAG TPA: outer membrane protein assembly factor BamA [Candidatus Limnocylindrales bacterium]|nr:outer membrane protein assembly factor BamA [Candidatus Limnocylindrales bacterium]